MPYSFLGGLTTAAALSALVLVQRPLQSPISSGPEIDPKAVALMDSVEAKMRRATTIEAVKRSTVREAGIGGKGGEATGNRVLHIWVKRPDRYRVVTLEADDEAVKHAYSSNRISNGKARLTAKLAPINPKTKKWDYGLDRKLWSMTQVIERTSEDEVYVWDDDVQTLAGLFVIDDEHPGIGHDWRHHKLSEPTFKGIRLLGNETWRGKEYQVVEWDYEIGIHPLNEKPTYRQKIYVGSDTLVYRVVTTTSKGSILEDDFQTIKLNGALSDTLFRMPPSSDSLPKQMYSYQSRYKVGSTLPDFTLPSAAGDTINLTKALQGKKGAILWFWDFW